jgi:hypothetical protein
MQIFGKTKRDEFDFYDTLADLICTRNISRILDVDESCCIFKPKNIHWLQCTNKTRNFK